MDRDGTNDGYDLALTAAVSEAVGVPVIASGGAGELEHLAEALQAGADAALCASIFHYGRYTIAEAKAHLTAAGIPVRGLRTLTGSIATMGEHTRRDRRAGAPARAARRARAARAGRGAADIALVGGAVRDLLLGRDSARAGRGGRRGRARPRSRFARELATRWPAVAEIDEHERFGTALVCWDGGRDRRRRRAAPSATPRPARCPRCEPATLEEDLLRRDFTVNAIAVALGRSRTGAGCARRRRARGSARRAPARAARRELQRRSHAPAAPRALLARAWASQLEPHTAALAAQRDRHGRAGRRSPARASAPSCGWRWANPTRSARSPRSTSWACSSALHQRLRFDEAVIAARARAAAAATARRRSAAAGRARRCPWRCRADDAGAGDPRAARPSGVHRARARPASPRPPTGCSAPAGGSARRARGLTSCVAAVARPLPVEARRARGSREQSLPPGPPGDGSPSCATCAC